MRNPLVLVELNAEGVFEPVTGATVQAYVYDDDDVNKRGSLIGSFTEEGNGKYYIDLTRSTKVTVTVGGANLDGWVGKKLDGDVAMQDEIDTTAIQDDAVSNAKLESIGDFE